ncbi:MAG: ATP-binding protein [Clostridiales bacterium]|jgi:AAA15 family ATPase/GTPase|nr:ATP-binding protein [Clostridiales bacterium]
MRYTVKLESIRLENIKNVEGGYIKFRNKKRNGGDCDIIGIYGQNGSGKTAVIDCMEIIQELFMGRGLVRRFFDCLYVNAERSSVTVEFSVSVNEKKYFVSYEAVLKFIENNTDFSVAKESLKCFGMDGDKYRASVVCDFEEENIFLPKRLFDTLTGGDKKLKTNLYAQKVLSKEHKMSFIFNPSVMELLKKSGGANELLAVISALGQYASMDLFVIKNSHSGIISLNELIPFSFKIEDGGTRIVKGEAGIRLDQPTLFPMVGYKDVSVLIGQLNVVIKCLVPNLQIEVKEYGEQVDDSGAPCMRFELLACSAGTKLPLRNESEGIKKIISILSVLISFYNGENTTVLIDEFDAGIFEYLLGELLSVLRDNARGQLIFTSHNLRPIEVLDRENIYFSSCNPKKRYIRLTNVKSNGNLRDFYYRTIELGGQEEKLFDETNLSELSLALRIAGNGGARR